MSGIIVSPVAALPSPVADLSTAALYQEIARMQAELEDLERRILRCGLCDSDEVAAPFEARAGSLVDRVVSSLLEAGRSDIRAAARQSDLHAEVVVYEARRRAEATLTAARRDLAGVLDARANSVDALKALGLEVSFLSDPGPTFVGAAEVGCADPQPPRAETPQPPAAVVDGAAAAIETAGWEPEPMVDLTEPSTPVVDSPVAEFGVALWEPESVVDLTEHSSAIAVEAARTDAAFDVWMSVAPAASPAAIPTAVAVAVAVADARPSTELVPIDSRGRPRARWAGSLEVLAALIGATGLLVLVLLLVG